MGLFRSLIDSSTQLLGYIKRHRQYQLPVGGDAVKVNLGCGLAVTKGWINVDGSLNALFASLPEIFHKALYRVTGTNRYYSSTEYCALLKGNTFLHHDLSYGILPFKNETVDFVYSSHFLEHLYQKEAERLLLESYRVLKPTGIIRICVPDLAYAVSLYVKGQKEQMLKNYFFVEDKKSYYARHKYMYDFDMLKLLLEKAGFKHVMRCAYQEGKTPDLYTLDNRADETLFVEASK